MAGTDRIQELIDWLVDGARTVNAPQEILQEICARLLAADVDIERCAVFVETLHPSIVGRRFLWEKGEAVQVDEASFALAESDLYQGSTIGAVIRTGRAIRLEVHDPACPEDFGIVADLRAANMTDYLIVPLNFSNGEVQGISWSTRRPGGFSNHDLSAFESIRAPLSRLAEVYALRRTATTLLNTYVGERSGARILEGHIRRGDVEAIEAAIWLSDLRGFSSLAESIDGAGLIDVLNEHFDCLVPAISEFGGEVLKFMGDGLLAIFPTEGNAGAAEACQAALGAAFTAGTNMAALNERRAAEGADPLAFGIALHIGKVHYGNIGGGDRLDFTAIGPAVNLAARLEAVAAELGRDVVVSEAFRGMIDVETEDLGRFEVKGFSAPVPIFGLSSEPSTGVAE